MIRSGQPSYCKSYVGTLIIGQMMSTEVMLCTPLQWGSRISEKERGNSSGSATALFMGYGEECALSVPPSREGFMD